LRLAVEEAAEDEEDEEDADAGRAGAAEEDDTAPLADALAAEPAGAPLPTLLSDC
jgi:hypothetical protein